MDTLEQNLVRAALDEYQAELRVCEAQRTDHRRGVAADLQYVMRQRVLASSRRRAAAAAYLEARTLEPAQRP